MISLFLPFILSAAIGSLDPMAVSDPTVSGSDFVISEDIEIENKIDSVVEALPEEPDSPIVSGGDYAEILHSIDDRLNYFEDLFYYGSSIDDMGNGFKLIIVLIFLVIINIVLKIINWR